MRTDGIILINKEKDWTSRDVVNKACGILKTKQIGHCGTLDPFATGLLILGVNKGTKALQFLESSIKRYFAKIKLAILTDTLDITGNILETRDTQIIEKSKIIEVLQGFLGKQRQKVPSYSAKKVNGKKLYEYARKNQEVEDVYSDIEIYTIDLIDYDKDSIIISCDVSKGTYIRQLAFDISNKLGTVGILEELTRVSIGNNLVNNATKIQDISYENVIGIEEALNFIPSYVVVGLEEKKARNGVYLNINSNENLLLIKSANGDLIAIYEKHENCYKSLRGF